MKLTVCFYSAMEKKYSIIHFYFSNWIARIFLLRERSIKTNCGDCLVIWARHQRKSTMPKSDFAKEAPYNQRKNEIKHVKRDLIAPRYLYSIILYSSTLPLTPTQEKWQFSLFFGVILASPMLQAPQHIATGTELKSATMSCSALRIHICKNTKYIHALLGIRLCL